ncbi:Uncharacterized protein YfhR [Madurella mycetomatis]|uniref:Uncharacterized protein YfhR n=1 Tax=Madurella mycetomatis TaxID=100816 RepID=A0A175WG00_9PEZI|nr:Uncharacterized protein YfhR [Madurella mycetomatis]
MATILQPQLPPKPHSIHEYSGLAHPPHLSRLKSAAHKAAQVEPLSIDVDDSLNGFVPGFLHLPPDFTTSPSAPLLPHHHRTAAILLSGAGGGVTGPSSIYLSLACKLATLGRGIPTLRLDYRFPSRTAPCVADARAGMGYLRDMYGLDRFVLVGWSFGGAVVFTAAGEDERVIGCATVASQTVGTEGIRKVAPRPVLLMHGTADHTLSDECSKRLYEMYGGDGNGRLELFDGDNHALSRNAEKAEEMLCEFVAGCAGVRIAEGEREKVVDVELIDDRERHELMERGGDLREPERED